MLFEKFVKQHRVHCFVAHAVRSSLIVTGHEIRIYLFYFLCHKTELWNALGVKVVLVTERHRFERENRFARLVHRLDLLLVTIGGKDRAEVTVGIDYHSYAFRDYGPTDAGHVGGALRCRIADPDRARVVIPTVVTNHDVVISTALTSITGLTT